MIKPYSFKLNDLDEDERQLIELLDTWRDNGGTVKSFLMNQLPKGRQSQYVTREEWIHEKNLLHSAYKLIDDLINDMVKMSEDMIRIKSEMDSLSQNNPHSSL